MEAIAIGRGASQGANSRFDEQINQPGPAFVFGWDGIDLQAMNPFTRFLMQWSQNAPLEALVERWDVLEALVIRVYKNKVATAVDEEQYQQAKIWLEANYDQFAPQLKPYWQPTKVGGSTDHGDPFCVLFAPDTAVEFVNNWRAMQHLPAAREALNQLIVAQDSGE